MPSKRRVTVDASQLTIDFEAQIEAYEMAKIEIMERVDAPRICTPATSEDEICIEIASACKQALRETDLSRDQLVDKINEMFGRGEPEGRRPLSLNMLNNYLSKPAENPMPIYYLYAIQQITGSLAPARALIADLDALIITGEEDRQLKLGKLDDIIAETRRLKKELRGKR